MVSVSPDTVAFIVTAVIWFIGAIFLILVVHPWRLALRLKRDGLTKAAIVSSVRKEVVDPMNTLIHNGFEAVDEKIGSITMPSLPESIPSMEEIRTLVKGAAKISADHLEEVRKAMPSMIVRTMDSQEAWAVLKKYEGRIYRMKGINIEDHQKGIDAAQEVYMEKIENDDPTDHTEIKMIIKDAIKIAADGGLIDPENTDQKIGLVEGVLRIAKRLQQYQSGRPAGKGSKGMKPAR